MDQDVKITIGIPFYNAGRFLEFSIRSVLNQSYKFYELILSDDGSTDDSLIIARSFNDSRIIVHSDNKNRGISYRLNEQISLAKGEYFVRMDADDIMFPNRLERQLQYLQKYHNIDVIGSYAIVIDDENGILGLRKSKIPNSIKECFSSGPFIHPTVMGKIEWFRRFKYSLNLNGVEDTDLWLRAYSNSNFFIIEEPLLFYRDPYRLKFRTYKFRTLQLNKLYKTNCNLLYNSRFDICYLTFVSFFKITLYWIFKTFYIEIFLLKRRNNHLNKLVYDEALSLMNSIKKH